MDHGSQLRIYYNSCKIEAKNEFVTPNNSVSDTLNIQQVRNNADPAELMSAGKFERRQFGMNQLLRHLFD